MAKQTQAGSAGHLHMSV